MSHAYSAVKFEDGKILYGEFNATVGYVQPKIYETEQEVEDHWRETVKAECSCGNDEPVRIMTIYGGGFAWSGRACRNCHAITDGFAAFDTDENNYEDALPEWSPWKKDEDGIL